MHRPTQHLGFIFVSASLLLASACGDSKKIIAMVPVQEEQPTPMPSSRIFPSRTPISRCGNKACSCRFPGAPSGIP